MADGRIDLEARVRLDQLERDLADLRRRAARAGQDAGEDLGEGMGDRATARFSGAKAGMAAAGAALGVAAVAGFANALDNEQANANFAASLGLDADAAAAAGKLAGGLYADNFGDSLESVQSALGSLDAAGLVNLDGPKAEVEDLTGKMLTLVDVFELDMPKAVNTAGVMLKQGLAKDGQHAADLLTKAMQMVAPSLREDLIDSLNEYSVFFSQLGFTGEEAMSALVSASQGGAISIDKVGDAMKELTIRAVDGSKLTTDAYAALGLDADKTAQGIIAGGDSAAKAVGSIVDNLAAVEDPVKRSQLGVALFGTQFEDLGQDAIPILSSLGKGLDGVEGSAAKMVETVGGTNAAKLETFKRSMEQNVTNVMGSAISAIEKLPGPLQTVVGTFVGILPVLAPLTPIFAAFIPMIIGMGTAAGGASFSLGAMAASLWAVLAPVLAVIAVLAAVIAVGYLVVRNWDTIKEAAAAVWDWVGAKIGVVADLVVGHFTWLRDTATQVWGWITDKVSGFIDFFTGIPGRIASAASGMWDGIKDAFRSAVNWIISAWNRLGIPGFSIDIDLPGPIPDIHFSWGGLSLPNIPLLDSGGVITGPTLAALSVNRKPEAVIPLDRLESMVGLGAGERTNSGRGGNIIVQGSVIAERELLRIARRRIDDVGRHNPSAGVKARRGR